MNNCKQSDHDPVTIVIGGDPVAKGRPRITRKGFAYTPAATRLRGPFWITARAGRRNYPVPVWKLRPIPLPARCTP
jgi:hypothetical protein